MLPDEGEEITIVPPTKDGNTGSVLIKTIAVDIAGYTPYESNSFRRVAVAGGTTEHIAQERKRFVAGTVKKHAIEKAEAERIFDLVRKVACRTRLRAHDLSQAAIAA